MRGGDANKNGKLDADERDYTISGSRTYMIFRTGGKATYKFVDDTDPSSNFEVDFTWSLQNNDTEIVLDDLEGIYVSPTKIVGRITTLNDTQFIIEYDDTNYNNETFNAYYVMARS